MTEMPNNKIPIKSLNYVKSLMSMDTECWKYVNKISLEDDSNAKNYYSQKICALSFGLFSTFFICERNYTLYGRLRMLLYLHRSSK